jgi:hypothetical protein
VHLICPLINKPIKHLLIGTSCPHIDMIKMPNMHENPESKGEVIEQKSEV